MLIITIQNGNILESDLNDENLHLRDNNNEEVSIPYSSHVSAVVNKKKTTMDHQYISLQLLQI